MIMDQHALGIRHGLLDRLKLLGDIKAGFPGFQHRDNRAKVAVGTFQPGNQRRVTCMDVCV
jgi:hypothetical protein